MNDVVIKVENLGKRYRIGAREKADRTFREVLMDIAASPFWRIQRLGRAAPPEETIWALKDVSLEVKRGEVVGIIGRNGAGKSTVLKILSRITEPTEGRVEIRGRVASLLEVGTGFHEELTGRENIFLNGAVLGMTRKEIQRKFDEIVAFSEIEKFIDTPVKRYSSGMKVRLAFAVAAHLEPEILLVDEVLAVGDVSFQKKCLGKMNEVSRAGRTGLFVSHNMAAVQSLCQRGILLRQGRLAFDGPVDEVVRDYLAYLTSGAENAFDDNPERSGNGRVRLTGARVLDDSNQLSQHLVAGKPASFEFMYENPSRVSQANVVLTIYNHLGAAVTHLDMRLTNFAVNELGASGRFICRVPNLPLPIGQYRIAVAVQIDGEASDLIPNALVFEVQSSTFFESGRTPKVKFSACMVGHKWRHEIAEPLSLTDRPAANYMDGAPNASRG